MAKAEMMAATKANDGMDDENDNSDSGSIMEEADADAEAEKAVVVENRYSKKDIAPTSTSAPSTSCAATSNEVFSPELLSQYYARLFPFDLLYQWLSYAGKERLTTATTSTSNTTLFRRREFSFTIEPVPGEEVYIRYQSFGTAPELAAAVTKRRPVKIDLGAIFSHPPCNQHAVPKSAFVPEARELVFDIDLTDYDSIRQCGCSGASICKICWKFMDMAVRVVDEGLRTDFGFAHIGWFYSGRRGIHCWVCDERARDLTDAGRSAVASYFNVRALLREGRVVCCLSTRFSHHNVIGDRFHWERTKTRKLTCPKRCLHHWSEHAIF
jgi:DNA primase catalytic subunit